MRRLAQPEGGLFPRPKEIEMDCSCPDVARVCKHIAAVIYGVVVRLDASPELLFTLRSVDHSKLITEAVDAENLERTFTVESSTFAAGDLGELFGIELATSPDTAEAVPAPPARKPRARIAKARAAKQHSVTATSPAPLRATRKSRKGQPRHSAANAVKSVNRARRGKSKLST